MPRILRNVVIAHTNDFTPKQHEDIKRWVEANGGCFSKDVTPEVTHLISSKEAWKRYSDRVKQAREQRATHIVKRDWLEDSLLKRPPKLLDEKKYAWESKTYHKIRNLQKESKRSKQIRKSESGETSEDTWEDAVKRKSALRIEKAGKQFDNRCKKFEGDMNTKGYHPYTDKSGFSYLVTLLRQDASLEVHEKYNLQLYESHNQPHSYSLYIHYSKIGSTKPEELIGDQQVQEGAAFDFAFEMFQRIFAKKCGFLWNQERSSEINSDGEEERKIGVIDREPFIYIPRTWSSI